MEGKHSMLKFRGWGITILPEGTALLLSQFLSFITENKSKNPGDNIINKQK